MRLTRSRYLSTAEPPPLAAGANRASPAGRICPPLWTNYCFGSRQREIDASHGSDVHEPRRVEIRLHFGIRAGDAEPLIRRGKQHVGEHGMVCRRYDLRRSRAGPRERRTEEFERTRWCETPLCGNEPQTDSARTPQPMPNPACARTPRSHTSGDPPA